MRFFVIIVFCAYVMPLFAADTEQPSISTESFEYAPRPVEKTFRYGDAQKIFKAVAYRDITAEYPAITQKGLRTISYNPFPSDRKKNFQILAYLGIPDGPVPAGGFPSVVLEHGGCGWANVSMIHFWNARGIAAIAMSCEGVACTQEKSAVDAANLIPGVTVREYAGGKQLQILLASFPGLPDYTDHIAAYVRAHTIIRSLPNINQDKTFYMGQSWGAVKGSILCTIDTRLRCGILLSGCGAIQHKRWQRPGGDSLPRQGNPESRPVLYS